jgi:hypothetical protein
MEISFGLHYQQNLSEESSGLFATTTCGGNRTLAPFGRSAQMDFQPYFASRYAQT